MLALSGHDEAAHSGQPNLVSLDQTYVCFDVEQPCDARQDLVIRRDPSVGKGTLIAYRVRTNAPTRYIVCPNSGILTDQRGNQTIGIELVGNRYNPYHRLVIQAIRIESESEVKQVWKSNRLKKDMQAVPLELSTTLMNIDHTQSMTTDSNTSAASLSSVLEQSSTTGAERVQELEALCNMLKADIEKVNGNVIQAQRLKEVLDKHLEQRKQLCTKLKEKLQQKESAFVQMNRKIESQESMLKHLQAPRTNEQSNCRIS